MKKYLYGASVQGIQNFIFQTNKLKEIVGASQLVDNICTTEFEAFCANLKIQIPPDDVIMSAAGNIKCLVDKTTCEKLVCNFPKYISNYAPGITISQAVVECDTNLKDDINQLEQRLKAQRNQAAMPVDIGFMGLERARRTGGVAVDSIANEGGMIDRATVEKIAIAQSNTSKPDQRGTLALFEKFSGSSVKAEDVPFNIEEITKQKENGWLAIVHADGNGLGLLLQNLAHKLKTNEQVKVAFATFSKKLEQATQEAAQIAFNTVIPAEWQTSIITTKERYPIRPVVLGGDDLTVIIRADIAFDFTRAYLQAFEATTKKYFAFMKKEYGVVGFEQGLTACAGIAYIKTSYPFHYGVHLAESITASTKKTLKERYDGKAPSALNFYKVQASFIDDLPAMKKRTHFAKAANVSFDYGPYLVGANKEDTAHIDELKMPLAFLLKADSNGTKGVSKLRQWAAELHKDKSKATFMLDRMEQVNPMIYKEFKLRDIRQQLESPAESTININDLIVLSSF